MNDGEGSGENFALYYSCSRYLAYFLYMHPTNMIASGTVYKKNSFAR